MLRAPVRPECSNEGLCYSCYRGGKEGSGYAKEIGPGNEREDVYNRINANRAPQDARRKNVILYQLQQLTARVLPA